MKKSSFGSNSVLIVSFHAVVLLCVLVLWILIYLTITNRFQGKRIWWVLSLLVLIIVGLSPIRADHSQLWMSLIILGIAIKNAPTLRQSEGATNFS